MTPHFDSFSKFVQMGGHGFYVWLCWGIVLATVLIGVYYVRSERKKTLHALKIAQQRKKSKREHS